MIQRFSLLFFLLGFVPKIGQSHSLSHSPAHISHYTWTPKLRQAYEAAISLRFEKGEAILQEVKNEDPENLLILLVENYIDFFRVYINEDYREFEKLERNKDKRLKEIERHGEDESPWHLFLQADIRLHWALGRLKFEEYATSFFETNKAFKLLTENEKKFPDFMPNKKDLGILHAMVGTIPESYKWAVDIFSSLDGTIEQGREELESVIEYAQKNEDFIFEKEIYVYYAYLMLHLGNDSEEAWRIVNTSGLDASDDPMSCFILSNVAMRTDRGDEAIQFLEKRPKGAEFHPFHYLDYMLGLAKLQRLDSDADTYLLRYVRNFKGQNFIKDAYQKLAWSSLVKGDKNGYLNYINECKSKGNTIVGSDKSAQEEATRGEVPAVDLLKARLLFDGGRFQKAYELLSRKNASVFTTTKNKVEYTYRMGRVTHKLGKWDEAIKLYDQTIEKGKDEPWYFACRAALEKGHIYEGQNQMAEARKAFEQCLDIDPEEHRTGLHQQAKAGLGRLKK